MASDKMQSLKNMNTRQKVMAGIIVVVVLIIIWQLKGLFSSGDSSPPISPTTSPSASTSMGASPGSRPPVVVQQTPKPAELLPVQPTPTPDLMRLQEAQARYVEAIDALQMLKVTRDIANTNKDISTAKLAQVMAEKKIVELLSPPPPPTPAESLAKNIVVTSPAAAAPVTVSAPPPPSMPTSIPPPVLGEPEVKYTVVSVSQLQYRWGAILSNKGILYSVHVGDLLPPDGARVMSIQKDGVVIEKGGIRRKLSLVPMI